MTRWRSRLRVRQSETPLGPDGIYLDDYVTIDCLHEGKRLIALKITVTEVLPVIDVEPVTSR